MGYMHCSAFSKSEVVLGRRHWQYKVYVCVYIVVIYVFAHHPLDLAYTMLVS